MQPIGRDPRDTNTSKDRQITPRFVGDKRYDRECVDMHVSMCTPMPSGALAKILI